MINISNFQFNILMRIPSPPPGCHDVKITPSQNIKLRRGMPNLVIIIMRICNIVDIFT